MKLWIDDVRPAPEGYTWVKSVTHAKIIINNAENAINGALETINSWESNYANSTEHQIEYYERSIHPVMKKRIEDNIIELLDIDHDAGSYAKFGGDYIKLLDWLEETGRNYPIRIHSANPVGMENMRRIIERNGWKEVK
jgi:hypothetical protein